MNALNFYEQFRYEYHNWTTRNDRFPDCTWNKAWKCSDVVRRDTWSNGTRFAKELIESDHHYRDMPEKLRLKTEEHIKALLHAQRDCDRNQGKDTSRIGVFDTHGTYYCEAFGMLRTFYLMGYGFLMGNPHQPSGDNPPNLKAWLHRLEHEVLEEEGYYSDGRCEHCLSKWGKDDRSMRERREAA